jgi:hypothetical protein
VKNQNDQ